MDALEPARDILRYIAHDKNILYVICPSNIGDLLAAGCLCHALLKKKRKRTCVLIALDRFKNCGLNFVGVKEVRYISRTLINLTYQYVNVTREYETDDYFYVHTNWKRNPEDISRIGFSEDLPFMDRYKKYIFDLPVETELLPPIIDSITAAQKQRLHETYILDKKRTIILAPYANSVQKLEESFWAKLVTTLLRKNNEYILYTNVAAPNEKVIPGTAPIVTTFPELIYLAEKVNCFIGLRSGLFDLLAFTNARLLYINRNIFDLWDYDLDINFNHTNSKAFYIGISEWEEIKAFMNQNNIHSPDKLIFFDHVKGSDVSFEIDSLIKKIVDSVD